MGPKRDTDEREILGDTGNNQAQVSYCYQSDKQPEEEEEEEQGTMAEDRIEEEHSKKKEQQ